MANFILIHGTGGNPDECFYPWLRQRLEEDGHKVYAPQLPMPENQSLQTWLKAFEPYWKYVNKDAVFVGRSIGPVFILRLLERTKVNVKASFLVAGFCSDIGLPSFTPLIRTFVDKPFGWQKIMSSCGRFFVYNSDNDPYVPLEKGKELAKNLGTELALVKGAEHFWFEEFPKLLTDINKVTED
ncbi:alpha/beta hydrolase [Candidatus Woesearchaeota archaeon]|nr:alpha/beta hydrolase [Candidatus Woesearchaeota archaeon]